MTLGRQERPEIDSWIVRLNVSDGTVPESEADPIDACAVDALTIERSLVP